MNYYQAGNMFYIKVEELAKFRSHVIRFITGN